MRTHIIRLLDAPAEKQFIKFAEVGSGEKTTLVGDRKEATLLTPEEAASMCLFIIIEGPCSCPKEDCNGKYYDAMVEPAEQPAVTVN